MPWIPLSINFLLVGKEFILVETIFDRIFTVSKLTSEMRNDTFPGSIKTPWCIEFLSFGVLLFKVRESSDDEYLIIIFYFPY